MSENMSKMCWNNFFSWVIGFFLINVVYVLNFDDIEMWKVSTANILCKNIYKVLYAWSIIVNRLNKRLFIKTNKKRAHIIFIS